jgi:outer membrane protein assembly factor BamA
MSGLRMSRGIALAAAIIAVFPGLSGAQEAKPTEAKKSSTIVIPIFFYSPETRWGGGVGGIVTFWPDKSGPGRRPSSVMFVGTISQNKQFELSAKPELYLAADSVILTGNVYWKKFPSKFFGIGNDAPDSGEEGFTPRQIFFEISAVKRIWPGRNLFAGLTYLLDSYKLLSFDPAGRLSGGTISGSRGGSMSGAGAVLKWDSRDNVLFPRSGKFFQFSAVVYGRTLGSDFSYTKVKADLRTYVPVGRSHILAFQASLLSAFGTVPFMALPMFGTDNSMRGFYSGRFRDNLMITAQTEYRLPVFWRFGLVGFAGVGRVADHLGNLGLSGWKYSVGWGIRFRVTAEGANLRLDFGYGNKGTSGMYLTAGEAF